MAIEAISNVESTPSTSSETFGGVQDIGKEGFLKLLITQMQNQGPLDPISNEDFAAQLAQFSTLEQMQTMNKSFGTLNNLTEMSSAAGLIGKEVNYYNEAGESSGVVDRVILKPDGLYLSINGMEVNAENISEISLPSSS